MMSLLNELPCAVIITDGTGTIQEANTAMAALTRVSVEALTRQVMDNLFPPASQIFLQTHVWPTLLRDGHIHEVALELIDAQAHRISALVNARLNRHGPQVLVYWTFFVAHERRAFEQKLLEARNRAEASARAQEQNERFTRTIMDALPGLVAYWDQDLRCLYANKAYTASLGLQREALIGRHLADVMAPELLQFVEPHIRAVLAGERQQFERPLMGADGTARETSTDYIPDLTPQHEVQGFIVQINDITELKIAAAALRAEIAERKQVEATLQRSQDFLEQAGHIAGVGAWEVDLKAGQVRWRAEVHRIHGEPLDYVPTLEEGISFYAPTSRPLIEAAVQEAIAHGKEFDLELEIIRRDGSHRWVRAVGSAVCVDGEAVRLIGAFQDVTERRRLTQTLAEQHELLRVTLHSIGDAVITTNAAHQVEWLNPAAERMTGWASDQASGLPLNQVFQVVNEATREPIEDPITERLAQESSQHIGHQALLLSRDGSEYGIEDSVGPIRNEAGDILGAVLVFRDVSEQRRMSGEMKYRATHDALTGLVNRSEFETRLQRVLRQSHEEHSSHALLCIDLDQFKLVNDTCGHTVGDQLLQQVSKLLTDAIRASDTLARMGGDEFAILLEYCTTEQAQRIAQKICDQMDDFRFIKDEHRFRIGTSIGLVPVDMRWLSTPAIMQAADASCYAAKEGGRNRVHAWCDDDATMQARHHEMQWTSRIERALDSQGFELFAQRIEGLTQPDHGIHAEVLLRMRSDDGDVVLPGAFLPAAERYHLISRVDRWVLLQVIQWMKSLTSLDVIDLINVNLSGQSVGDRTFHAWTHEQLAEAGPQICAKLCLEITETVAVTNLADAATFIRQVRATGVKVALDDFGAGASSFGYLKTLPVDLLKIDGQFIRDLVTDQLDDAAVRCFVNVAQVVGVRTVAEFVDKPEVLQRLRDIGVDFAQGYLIHRPEPIDNLLGASQA